jgi:hypothetical protein
MNRIEPEIKHAGFDGKGGLSTIFFRSVDFSSNLSDNPYEPRPLNPSFDVRMDTTVSRSYPNNDIDSHRDSLIYSHTELLDTTPGSRFSHDSFELLGPPVKRIDSPQASCGVPPEERFFDPFLNHPKHEEGKMSESMSPKFDPDSNMVRHRHQFCALFHSNQSKPLIMLQETRLQSLVKPGHQITSNVSTETTSFAEASLRKLKLSMCKSRETQNLLQQWDKQNGLPRSHCSTMVNTNRSRRQLEEDRILTKWNGKPLIQGFNVKQQGNSKHSVKRKTNHKSMHDFDV